MPATSKPVFEGPKTLKVMLMKPAALFDYPYSVFGEIQYTYVIMAISDMEHKKIKVFLPPKTFFINKIKLFYISFCSMVSQSLDFIGQTAKIRH